MTDEAMSPLRRRMIEDMAIRKLAPKTQQGYIRTVKDFAAFLGRSPDTASFEDVRRFQLHLAANGTHIPILNHTVAALRFFFRVTLKRSDIVEHSTFIHEPRKLPVVLSPEEVARAATSSTNACDPVASDHTLHPRRSNPQSARRPAARTLPAVSSLGGFRTPASSVLAPLAHGRHPKTFTRAAVLASAAQCRVVPESRPFAAR
jgi:hypothetical protein